MIKKQMNGATKRKSEAGAKVFTYGLCANALVMIHSVGLLDLLQQRNVHGDEIYDHEKYPDSIAIKGGLLVLQYGEILTKTNSFYSLTPFGKEVIEDMPSFLHWFDSYAKLLGKSIAIAQGKEKAGLEDFSIEEVAFTGDLVKEQFMPVIMETLQKLQIKGDFCDLWCGNGHTIINICKKFQVNGIGFDKSQKMVDLANKNLKWQFQNTTLYGQAHLAEMTNISSQYPHVDVLYTNFITHHLNPDELCTATLRSLQKLFPNARYLLLMDGVTPTEKEWKPEIFSPGFDYIHRLQRIETRDKKRLDKIIRDTGYEIKEEIQINFPNHYLWVLKMKNENLARY